MLSKLRMLAPRGGVPMTAMAMSAPGRRAYSTTVSPNARLSTQAALARDDSGAMEDEDLVAQNKQYISKG